MKSAGNRISSPKLATTGVDARTSREERRSGVMSKESARLRDLAAESLRAGRASSDPVFRQTCFGVAAAYKRFALGVEMLEGGPLRSQGRRWLERRPRASGLV